MQTFPRRLMSSVLLAALAFAAPFDVAPVEAQPGARHRPVRPDFGIGQPVQVEWNGQWYDAVILSFEPATGTYGIRYEGWSEMWNEPVPPHRVRPRAGGPRPPAPPPPQPPMPPQPDYYEPGPRRPGRPGRNDLVVNGSFEQPSLRRGEWQVLPGIQGWFVTSGPGIEVQSGTTGRPYEGRQLVELDGHAPTGIAQDLPTQRGRRYMVQLAFSARPGTPAADNRVGVYWDGELVAQIEADGSRNNDTSWQVLTIFVRARGDGSRLELRDEGTPNSLGTYIDDVHVVPVR